MTDTAVVKKPNIWILAGTSEGRKLAERLSVFDIMIYVSLATEYGKWFIKDKDNIQIITGRLDQDEMLNFIQTNHINGVIDATHPYAQEVTKNISAACKQTDVDYYRLLRAASQRTDVVYASNTLEASKILTEMDGKIFITCGSKEIESFVHIPNFSRRLYIRVLPIPDVLQKCLDLGFKSPHIIAMQGPFSKELNMAMFKSTGAEILVTKDSGHQGGFNEKIEAALELGLEIIVIGRPGDEEGYSEEEVYLKIIKRFGLDAPPGR